MGSPSRKNLGSLKGLEKSISEYGLLHPIVITPEGVLIAGLRRLEAVKQLGWREIPVHIIPIDSKDIWRASLAENSQRMNLQPSDMVAIAERLREIESDRARKRQLHGKRITPSGNFPEGEKGEVRNIIARQLNVSGRTLEKATEVVKAAQQEPEKYNSLVEMMDQSRNVHGAYIRLKVLRQIEELRINPPVLPKGKFQVIVADPPWPAENNLDPKCIYNICPYPVMPLEEIRALPMNEKAYKDAVLWLWVTNAFLPEAFSLLEHWGFEYKNNVTWVKDRPGLGNLLMGQTEHCLLAIKGNPSIFPQGYSTALFAKVRNHSQKPEEFYEMVEKMCPGRKLEFFAREKREGWEAFGDEVVYPETTQMVNLS